MQFFREQQYAKRVREANKKGYTYQPELYKDKFNSKTKVTQRQKLPRPIGAVNASSTEVY